MKTNRKVEIEGYHNRGILMKNITLSNGTTVEVECLSCALTSGIIEPDGGAVYETEHFHAHQDVAYPIKGLMILASKRHIKCFDELTDQEQLDYIKTLSKIRHAQRKVLGIEYVYYFYNEDTAHHFHTWKVPRYDWMAGFGRSIESVRPILLYARNEMNNKENIDEVMAAINSLRKELNNDV